MRRVTYLALAALISGCTSSADEIIPQNGPSMVDLYDAHVRGAGRAEPGADAGALEEARSKVAGPIPPAETESYTRTAGNEIDNLFPTLENPNLVMYVFPHLTSDERLPVPGYSTSFPMFERTEFALPGETAVPAAETPKPQIRIISGQNSSSTIRTY